MTVLIATTKTTQVQGVQKWKDEGCKEKLKCKERKLENEGFGRWTEKKKRMRISIAISISFPHARATSSDHESDGKRHDPLMHTRKRFRTLIPCHKQSKSSALFLTVARILYSRHPGAPRRPSWRHP
jgi:hypothetical protein